MASKALANVIGRLRSLASLQQAGQQQDSELLQRFVERHDEAAFTALVERHAPMALKVCRRVLEHQQDAEDACQATFLVLVRKAASIQKRGSLSSWLHGVALRVSMKLRRQIARSRRSIEEIKKAHKEEEKRYTCGELASVLDEELDRLPEKLRAPLILCYLQAKTRDEAAAELGLEPGTLKGRLETGRKRLHARLTRRGVALSTALLAGLASSASAGVPATLAVAIVKTAVAVGVGKEVAAGVLASNATMLANQFLHALFIKQLQSAAAVLLVALAMAGAGWFTYRSWEHQADNSPLAMNLPPAKPADEQTQTPPRSPSLPDSAPMEKQEPPREPDPPAAVNGLAMRGQELAARCAACHSVRKGRAEREHGEDDLARNLPRETGKKRERESAEEIPDISGKGRWNEDRMIKFLTRARSESPRSAHQLTLHDAQAVTQYLRSLPPRKREEGRRDD
jgi:RNA polymerase sigma-70 factor (ECF subfamily)